MDPLFTGSHARAAHRAVTRMSNKLPIWRRYLRLTRPDVAADVNDELQFHLDMRIADNMRRGMTSEAARAEAFERFGEVHPVREQLVEHDRHKENQERRREFFGDFIQDV